ncbi:DnaJ (Hsp40), sub B, member 12 [Homalodisca vitripennis]|nr:DnaJ (Hsp40), sub B, member 12 [Homalodisca vitripennis]
MPAAVGRTSPSVGRRDPLDGEETMLWKARNFGDRDLFSKAQNIKTPSCDALGELSTRGG